LKYLKFLEFKISQNLKFFYSNTLLVFFKLNCDASVSLDERRYVAGRVLRDFQGKVLFSFAANIGFCSLLHVEFWAIYMGVSVAWNREFRGILIEFDSIALRKGCDPHHPCFSLVQSIKSFYVAGGVSQWNHVLVKLTKLGCLLELESFFLMLFCLLLLRLLRLLFLQLFSQVGFNWFLLGPVPLQFNFFLSYITIYN